MLANVPRAAAARFSRRVRRRRFQNRKKPRIVFEASTPRASPAAAGSATRRGANAAILAATASVATADAMGEEALRCLERAGLRDAKSGAVDLDVTDQKVRVRGTVRCLMARQSTSSRAHNAH